MRNNSTICVTELLLNFSNAIACLANNATKINLAWQKESAYDEWDAVTQAVFNALVRFPIEWGINQNQKVDISLPIYDVFFDDYSNYSYFECTQANVSEKTHVFHSFITKRNPMDTVRVLEIGAGEKVVNDHFLEIPLEKVKFVLIYKEVKNKPRKINDITI